MSMLLGIGFSVLQLGTGKLLVDYVLQRRRFRPKPPHGWGAVPGRVALDAAGLQRRRDHPLLLA